jgi:glyoxylase-like metal-dependent hydrolase (beta-lactamase superfamily II)
LIVNTHYHSDHVGGHHALQGEYGLEIAGHPHDAELVNRRDPDTGAAEWLRQPIESYRVNRPLQDGDTIETGAASWHVLHTPGHTRGTSRCLNQQRVC